ncbi:lactamase [Bacillus sp. FJAT-27231]|uniref:MBL fold metallo-hydrolase n=1 Tax=Bacillus sp. FJAT-27231 TaxID=1679168 RepID=UPI0006713342|nr:MBL fold metallo-hydrolase [Bacillus sp. FJAT-27231]KMY52713.1 lactamase [Bacillus sp. FJAT-27231]
MDIQRIEETIYRIPIPVPFPMKYVFCYLFKEENGWTVVDTGLNYSEAREAWTAAFAEIGVKPALIQKIYLTHFHPDHFGLAGWLQEQTEADVYISQKDFQMAHRVWSRESVQAEEIMEMCQRHGMPADLSEQIKKQMNQLHRHVLPLPKLTVLQEAKVTLGGYLWEVISTPGHSDGLVCFYQPEKRLLLAADHVLDKITPNISLWPGASVNPLQDYFDSLQKIRFLDVNKTLPAHGHMIDHLSQRVQEIIDHHHSRLKEMSALAKDGCTAYEVAQKVFSHKKLNAHQWRFAMAETLAHLEFLVSTGELTKVNGRTAVQYMAPSPIGT